MSVDASSPSEKQALRRVIAAGFTGTLIEWYDFVIFGTISVLVFDKIFFPTGGTVVGLLASLGTFAVGFIARPIGGLFFGYLGDRIGRRPVLVITLTIMGVSTLGIGLLPTYETVGVLAPILLIILRLAQGFSLGGEWGGVSTILIEHAPTNERGKAGSFGQVGGNAGPLLANVVVTAISAWLTHTELVAWGWRIPFWFSVILILVSAYVRRNVSESESFTKAQAAGKLSKAPIREAVKKRPKQIFAVFAMVGGNTIMFYTSTVLLISYLKDRVGIGETTSLIVTGTFLVAASIACLIGGRVSDRIGRQPIVKLGSGILVVMAFPMFWLYSTGNLGIILITAAFLGAVHGGLLHSIQAAYFSELFPTKYRLGGMNLGYQAATVLIGSTAPILAVLMLEWTNGNPWMFSLYFMIVQALCFTGAHIAGETKGRSFKELDQNLETEEQTAISIQRTNPVRSTKN